MQHVCIRCNTKRSFPWHPDPPAFLVWAWSDDNCKHERLVQTISHTSSINVSCVKNSLSTQNHFHHPPALPLLCSSLLPSFLPLLHLLPLLLHSLVPGLSSSLHSFHGHGWGTFLPSGVSISCSWVDAHRLDDWYMPPYMKQCPWMHADKNRLDRANKLKIIINCTSNRLTSWALCAHFRMHIPHWKKSLPLEPCNAWCSWWHWDPIKAPAQLVLQLHSDDRLYVLDAFMPRPGR